MTAHYAFDVEPGQTEATPDEGVRVIVLVSHDPGPMREFRPILTVALDDAHATELLGKLALTLDAQRRRREPAAVRAPEAVQ